jgi:hypothetical protein
MAESSKRVTVHCDICDGPVEIEVTQDDLSKQKDGILRVMLAHGDPLHAIIVYIDKNFRIRGIEQSDSFQMDSDRDVSVVATSEVAENLSEALGEPCFQALYAFDDVKDREATAFVLDKTILRTVCDSGAICLSDIRKKVAFLEKALGDKIDLGQIEEVCEKYVREGLIRRA